MQDRFTSKQNINSDFIDTSIKKLDVNTADQEKPRSANESDKELFIRKTFEVSAGKGCELLFKLYYTAMCSYAVRFVYSKDIAEDLVSDIFYTFWKNESYKSVKSSYRSYLFKSVQNRSYNYLANELKNTDSLELLPQLDFASPEKPETLMHFEELCQKIDQIVEALPPQCQKVFLLNRFENKKIQEIALELNLSSRTIEGHISKALTALRQGLKDHWTWLILFSFIFR